MNNLVASIEKKYQKTKMPDFRAGDTVCVHMKIKEGDKERIQLFEGTVLGRHHGGTNATFIVRKISYGVGVERIFPLHSPYIEKIEIVKKGVVGRSKLYYLRERSGKAARIKEKRWIETLEQEVLQEVAAESSPVEEPKKAK